MAALSRGGSSSKLSATGGACVGAALAGVLGAQNAWLQKL